MVDVVVTEGGVRKGKNHGGGNCTERVSERCGDRDGRSAGACLI